MHHGKPRHIVGGVFALALALAALAAVPVAAMEPVRVYFFWSEGCPYCVQQKEFLAEVVERYGELVQVLEWEVVRNPQNHQLFRDVAQAHDTRASTIPSTFIGGSFWLGFHPRMEGEMEGRIVHCLSSGCPDPGELVVPRAPVAKDALTGSPHTGPPARPPVSDALPEITETGRVVSSTISIPLVGDVDLAAGSLVWATAIIAFVDGFNPCSLWVLTMLLAIVVYTRSRTKTLIVGLTFLLVTATVYGAFVAGAFNILSLIQVIPWITFLVAAIAFFFGLVNIKDYFFFQQGLSLTISEKHKPGIFKKMREIIAGNRSTPAMIGATVVMAAGIAIVELPCTAGFPLVWSGLVAAHQPGLVGFLLLLGLYILIYLGIELAIFFLAVITLKTQKFEEVHGRVLKLIGGAIMLALAVVLAVDKDIMTNLEGTLLVFGLALGSALLLLVIHRWILPRMGIVLGSEDLRVGGGRRTRGPAKPPRRPKAR